MALHRRCGLALANRGGLLVVLAPANFRQDACFLAGPLEAPERYIERFVFFDTYVRHSAAVL